MEDWKTGGGYWSATVIYGLRGATQLPSQNISHDIYTSTRVLLCTGYRYRVPVQYSTVSHTCTVLYCISHTTIQAHFLPLLWLWYCPGSHILHELGPPLFFNWPTAQSLHEDCPLSALCGVHISVLVFNKQLGLPCPHFLPPRTVR